VETTPNRSNTDNIEVTTIVALGWIVAAILAGFVALREDLSIGLTAQATALAIAPALLTLLLAPYRKEGWARVGIAFGWLALAGVAVGVTGGFESPLTVLFILAPAVAARTSDARHAAEAAFFALISYGVAGVLAPDGRALSLGPFTPLACAASLLATGALIAAIARAPARESATPPVDREGLVRANAGAEARIAAHRRRTAELAHELRTPLNHILGFSDAMRQQLFGPLDGRYREYIEHIHTSGRHLLDLVNGLLDLSRIEAGKYPHEKEAFDLRPLAEEVVALARHQAAEKGVVLALEADGALAVNADARALRQILTNLIANAVKFTPADGAVTVRAFARKGALELEVQDNGPGISAADRARLGKPYERGEAASGAEGYGLGLSLVRALSALHDGRLEFGDPPGGGALVRVTLPVLRA
jgi:signal transduction histidine kinase